MTLGTQSYEATTVPSKVLFSPEANSQFSGVASAVCIRHNKNRVIYMDSEGIQS